MRLSSCLTTVTGRWCNRCIVQHGMLEFGLMSSLEVMQDTALPNVLPPMWHGLSSSSCTGACCIHTVLSAYIQNLPCFIRLSSHLTTVTGRRCNRCTVQHDMLEFRLMSSLEVRQDTAVILPCQMCYPPCGTVFCHPCTQVHAMSTQSHQLISMCGSGGLIRWTQAGSSRTSCESALNWIYARSRTLSNALAPCKIERGKQIVIQNYSYVLGMILKNGLQVLCIAMALTLPLYHMKQIRVTTWAEKDCEICEAQG